MSLMSVQQGCNPRLPDQADLQTGFNCDGLVLPQLTVFVSGTTTQTGAWLNTSSVCAELVGMEGQPAQGQQRGQGWQHLCKTATRCKP